MKTYKWLKGKLQCFTSFIDRDLQIKTILRDSYTISLAHMKKSKNNHCWQRHGEKECSYTVDRSINWFNIFGIISKLKLKDLRDSMIGQIFPCVQSS